MSFLWTLTAGFLYVEAIMTILLLLPIISSTRWSKFFNSGLISCISSYASFYFRGCMCILALMVIEAVRNVWSQNRAYQSLKENPADFRVETEAVFLMRLFRAQRNLYVSGFAFFLWFILYRLVKLICEQAHLLAINEASLKQAKSASDAASRLLASEFGTTANTETSQSNPTQQLAMLKKDLKDERSARKKAETDKEILRKQAEQTLKEYDRVASECQALQKKLSAIAGAGGDKKSD